MSTANAPSPIQCEPQLLGQTVVVIGGSAGIGLETGRRARTEGTKLILTGRNPERLEHAERDLDALSSAAFDATDLERLDRFFDELPTPIDHVMVSGGGPYYSRLADIDFTRARRNVDEHFWLPLHVARRAVGKVRPGGTLLFIGGTGGRRPAAGAFIAAFTAAMPALTKALALELAPVRVNLIAPAAVGIAARRSAGRASRAAPHDPADPARGQPGRHRRARCPSHDEHSGHRSDLRHRRRPTARRG
jgi:NAD(P)-dependent dehydrogenase (short-subunit alcohol dehydrogenase family)